MTNAKSTIGNVAGIEAIPVSMSKDNRRAQLAVTYKDEAGKRVSFTRHCVRTSEGWRDADQNVWLTIGEVFEAAKRKTLNG